MIFYYWFKNVPEDRPGGPWWARDFDSEERFATFYNLAKPFLTAYAVDRRPGAEINRDPRTGTVRPPKAVEVRKL